MAIIRALHAMLTPSKIIYMTYYADAQGVVLGLMIAIHSKCTLFEYSWESKARRRL